jgi:hypothetical protein
MDPQNLGVVTFNEFVDWLCQMRIIHDRRVDMEA